MTARVLVMEHRLGAEPELLHGFRVALEPDGVGWEPAAPVVIAGDRLVLEVDGPLVRLWRETPPAAPVCRGCSGPLPDANSEAAGYCSVPCVPPAPAPVLTANQLEAIRKLRAVGDYRALREAIDDLLASHATLLADRDAQARAAYPAELTPALREALGFMVWNTGPLAGAFRAAGRTIPRKAEEEQAFVLDWLVRLVIRHGDAWRKRAGEELDALRSAPWLVDPEGKGR